MKAIGLMIATICLSCNAQTNTEGTSNNVNTMTQNSSAMTNDFYSLSILALNGKDTIKMSNFKGKKVLLVNVASKCGYTPQYEGLQALYEQYGDRLVIIGVPCNQFMNQEPGSSEDIQDFCKLNYGVTFPLTEKVDVKGPEQHSIYQWLTQKEFNGKDDYKVSWNFNKFLISENGELMSYFSSSVAPLDASLTSLL